MVLAAWLGACGADAPADLDDAGSGRDGAVDAGQVDAADGVDAGLLLDAASPRDASAERDASSADAGPPTVMRTYRVWVWNVAGNLIHRGRTDDGLIEVAVSSIEARDADFVGFNELCFSQYRALQAALRAAGWPEDPDNFSRFSQTRAAVPSICAGTTFGNAIFSRSPLGSAADLTLPSDGSIEERSLLCAPLRSLPHLRFCTTHITTSNAVGADGIADNARQLRAVLAELEDRHRGGDTVLIAGDFNAQPHYARLNRFYAPSLELPINDGNVGQYRELDDDDAAHCLGYGERTTEGTTLDPCGGMGTKIDLIFARETAIVGPYEGDSLSISSACGGPCSDHRIVIGTVTVRVRE